MQNTNQQAIIENAIAIVAEMSPQSTDGKWLEDLTIQVSPHIREWDIAQAWPWAEWPDREQHYPDSTSQDVGIDCVGLNGSGKYIAIQCKSRQLDAEGKGAAIAKSEVDKFMATTAGPLWVDRWVVTNGDVSMSSNVNAATPAEQTSIKPVNIHTGLQQQQAAFAQQQSKSDMQAEAVAKSVQILREHKDSDTGGSPIGQARGRIILPCGTGKTRISLRIVEELTPPGGLSIVLCPSIALVAQIRREYLEHTKSNIRALAVCSDQTAGYDPKAEDKKNATTNPTVDNSNVSADEIKGEVTTDSTEIAAWIQEGQREDKLNVIFGTYQSSHRIAEALRQASVTATVLICDEAHRTAGLRRKRNAKKGPLSPDEQRVRDFTVCHDNDQFPATYRVYQTATPRVYNPADTKRINEERRSDWIVRSMDDEGTFGVELYRKSYTEAVANEWLSKYRIIAVGINGNDVYDVANRLAGETAGKGKNKLTTANHLRGLAFALAMGGATRRTSDDGGRVPIKSCIAFMNTVAKSKAMAEDLNKPLVRDWLADWVKKHIGEDQDPAEYKLEHLDATHNVSKRNEAKVRLAAASADNPRGIINVGIFGEGTDSPALSSVAFLEPRKSPIDVIQAVGRAMRIADCKEEGYIICPIVIPPNVDPERWLSNSSMEEGWQELGQILLALRAHDSSIEDNLKDLMHLYLPTAPQSVCTFVAAPTGPGKNINYWVHDGPAGAAEDAIERVAKGASPRRHGFVPVSRYQALAAAAEDAIAAQREAGQRAIGEQQAGYSTSPNEPALIVTCKIHEDGTPELRSSTVVRGEPAADGTIGKLDIRKTRARSRKMINESDGNPMPNAADRAARREKRQEREEFRQLTMLKEMGEFGESISINLLEKSGLTNDRVARDLNILEAAVNEAAFHLRQDELQPTLNRHFMLDNLDEKVQKAMAEGKAADGCITAALLMMNAAMLHQRIANGQWLPGVSDLAAVKNDVNIVRRLAREWEGIMRHDFQPVLKPAVDAIYAIEDSGKLAGLERALRHIAAEAERIAETYADMGADHAGPLFNRVMGNQASDGAFFTRPVAASIAARLTLDAFGQQDWTAPAVWREHKTVDLACGSGTLLAAMLTDMKRRARQQGASDQQLADLQKLAVEETIKGMDINPVSLQLAAAQLTAGNQDVRYRRMGLHQMPYGPQADDPTRVAAGTLELLGQSSIVPRKGKMDLGDDKIASRSVWPTDDAELEDAVDAAKDARIVIMNPPFTNRSKMGEKFPEAIQHGLRERIDRVRALLAQADPELKNLATQNSVRPNFVSLADHCIPREIGVMAMINPTIALTGTSGSEERRVLSQRYHVHTILTCHQPGQINLSQNTNVNESIVVLRRHWDGSKPPTRFINLDRLPVDDDAVADWHRSLLECEQGPMPNGWGEVSYWPAERIAEDDWTPAIWRSPELAQAAYAYLSHENMLSIEQENIYAAGQRVREFCKVAEASDDDGFRLLYSKGADGQIRISAMPDSYYRPKDPASKRCLQGVNNLKARAAHLLITDGQRNATARVTAVASDDKYVGMSWMPVSGFSPEASKGIAVFLNSTPGRLQLMRNAGRTIEFPMYMPGAYAKIRIPNIEDARIRAVLADCWERTKDMEVPQFRDGECEVRRLWDEAVAEAMEWDADELARLRSLLNNEPHVRGLGYGQYDDEVEVEPADRERFQELADQWQEETVLLSNSDRKNAHPALQEIISMGQPVVPFILERMQSQGGHWFEALQQITGARPVPPESRGRIKEMTQAWLEWGELNGYV